MRQKVFQAVAIDRAISFQARDSDQHARPEFHKDLTASAAGGHGGRGDDRCRNEATASFGDR